MRVGVLLAAGASTRMGARKALVRTRGVSFLAHGVRHLWAACDAVVVVLGSDASIVRRSLDAEIAKLVSEGELQDRSLARRRVARRLELRFTVNRRWATGMLGSVRHGLKRALSLDPESIVLLPVDHPDIEPRTVLVLAAAMDAALGAYRGTRQQRAAFAYAVIPRYRRRRGHPIALSPGLAQALVRDSRAADLSDSIKRNARLVGYLDGPDPGVVRNRNHPRD